MIVLVLILSFIFIFLSVIHFNWALGSEWGLDNALPKNEEGELIFSPGKIDSAIVGIGLLCFSLFYLFQSNLITYNLPNWMLKYGSWIIPTIFMARAVGDFKYAGFFKKIKNSKFAELDSKIYSPLCLLIAILGVMIVPMN